MALIRCPECDKEVSDQATSCPNCGFQITDPMHDKMFCSRCGKTIDKNAVICPACGVPTANYQQHQAPAPVNVTVSNVNTNSNINANIAGMMRKPKNKWVALALCFFLGLVGAHKFYEGKVGLGIVYIITLGLLGIGVLIDFFVLLFKPDPYYV